MNILFLNGDYPFCYYYRGFLPGVYSNQMVVKDFLTMLDQTPQDKIVEQCKKADVIVFQRPNTKRMLDLMLLLKKMGKKVIFENDDSYLIGKSIDLSKLENDKQRQIAKDFSYYTDEILKIADGVIASTKVLQDEYAKINPNTTVLKNCIDPMDDFPCKTNKTGKFRIGLIGSVTTNEDYEHIKEDLIKLDNQGDITIVIMGVKYKDGTYMNIMKEDYNFWASLKNVEWHPYTHITDYMYTLSQLALDLAIIPRKENYFNTCKSNLKFLEMSLLEIPVLAQAFSNDLSPYQGVDEPYLTLADNWFEDIIRIKDNYKEYKQKAKRAKKYVLENYNIKSYAQEWVKEIEKLCKFQKNY